MLRPLRWLQRVFLIAGAAALIWCAVTVGDGVLAQRNAQRALEIALAVDAIAPPSLEKTATVLPRHQAPEAGSVVAALSIPRVQLSAMVLHGSDALTLRRGPGHLEHTAQPGAAGNIVIAGHRDSFFRPLRNVRVGDDIFLDTTTGQFHYEITSLQVVSARDVSVLAPTHDEVLTLITCYPFWIIGSAPDRFVVRAARVSEPRAALLAGRQLPVLASIAAPALATLPASTPVARRVEIPKDENDQIRRTVMRYLSVGGIQPASCSVVVNDDRANVDCAFVAESSSDAPSARLFALERSDGIWAIRSIELR